MTTPEIAHNAETESPDGYAEHEQYEQVGWLISGQEENRDEATGYTTKSWPTIEIFRCQTCGALVTDPGFHDRWHDLESQFDGEANA